MLPAQRVSFFQDTLGHFLMLIVMFIIPFIPRISNLIYYPFGLSIKNIGPICLTKLLINISLELINSMNIGRHLLSVNYHSKQGTEETQ